MQRFDLASELQQLQMPPSDQVVRFDALRHVRGRERVVSEPQGRKYGLVYRCGFSSAVFICSFVCGQLFRFVFIYWFFVHERTVWVRPAASIQPCSGVLLRAQLRRNKGITKLPLRVVTTNGQSEIVN